MKRVLYSAPCFSLSKRSSPIVNAYFIKFFLSFHFTWCELKEMKSSDGEALWFLIFRQEYDEILQPKTTTCSWSVAVDSFTFILRKQSATTERDPMDSESCSTISILRVVRNWNRTQSYLWTGFLRSFHGRDFVNFLTPFFWRRSKKLIENLRRTSHLSNWLATCGCSWGFFSISSSALSEGNVPLVRSLEWKHHLN